MLAHARRNLWAERQSLGAGMMERPEFPSVVDATFIATWRSCRRKAMLQYMQHWKPQGESVHLHAGAAFARGLEVARRAFYDEGQDSESAIAAGLLALVKAYGDFECPEGVNKSLDRMMGALEFYFHSYPMATDSAKPEKLPSGKHAIEFSFAQPLDFRHPVTGDPLIYAGRSDMICDYAHGRYLEDDKTASQLGASWPKQWALRSQFTGYCWAAREAGRPVDGVLVRGISILKTKYDTLQAVTYRPDWQIGRWLTQLYRDLAELQKCWESGYYDYALDHACTEYGGCAFTQICESNDPEAWLPMYFEKRRWNPLDRTEEKL
jgi:hypothetical protein